MSMVKEKEELFLRNMSLSKKEIIILKHLSDGQQHEEAPSSLSDAQFYVALKQLKEKSLVYAEFEEGGSVASSQIKTEGIAILDDIKSSEKRILKRLISNRKLSADQFELLRYARDNGKCDNIFGIDGDDYKEQICIELYRNKYIQSDYKNNKQSLILTRLGSQLVEETEDELHSMLSDDCQEEGNTIFPHDTIESESKNEIKDSGFRINEDRITDVIKTLWIMCDIGLFVDNNGKKGKSKECYGCICNYTPM